MKFEDGDEVVVIDLEGKRFFGEILTFDPEDDLYWVLIDGFGDAAIGIPADSDRLLPYLEADLEEEELETPSFGMSSEALAKYVGEFIERATARVVGVGKDQYDEGEFQKFEAMPITDLLDMLQEELQDAAVYAAMLDIRIKRYRNALEKEL